MKSGKLLIQCYSWKPTFTWLSGKLPEAEYRTKLSYKRTHHTNAHILVHIYDASEGTLFPIGNGARKKPRARGKDISYRSMLCKQAMWRTLIDELITTIV